MNLFLKALSRENEDRPPVWFMRQAGRYHRHYQDLKKNHGFTELCKDPMLACEVTMGPIEDFDFDAAILFSDILFPLEAMGMGLSYDPAPKLEWQVRDEASLKKLRSGSELAGELGFQAEAVREIRKRLPVSKGLIGFVGAPLTLYFYAVEGSHQNVQDRLAPGGALHGFKDGRYAGFSEKLLPLLVENMAMQAQAGVDAVALFDTCGGEVDAQTYRDLVVPVLKRTLRAFHERVPGKPVIYYSKNTTPEYWSALSGLPITCMGVDWHHPLPEVLKQWGSRYVIQGNVDPHWLLLEPAQLEARLRETFEQVKALPRALLRGWVCGLGHGVLKETPESNVRLFLKLQKEFFGKRA